MKMKDRLDLTEGDKQNVNKEIESLLQTLIFQLLYQDNLMSNES